MPETATPATEPATPAAAAPTTPEPEKEPDWKVESRKHEARSKEYKAKLDELSPQLKELEAFRNASKTDQQRLEEAAQTAKADADAARNEALRYRVALKHGISEEDFDLLGAGDEQELEARAARLAAKNAAAGQPAGPRPPAPNPAQGAAPGATSKAQQFAAFIQGQT